MLLYHITPKRCVPSILREGIKPGAKIKQDRVGLTRNGHPWTKVFLTDNVPYIAGEQAGVDWVIDAEAVVLVVDVTDLELQPHRGTSRNPDSTIERIHEFCVHDTIPPANIDGVLAIESFDLPEFTSYEIEFSNRIREALDAI